MRAVQPAPTLADVVAARAVVDRYLPRAPLEHSPLLSRELGGEVYLKLEMFKPTRTFKVRGALNKIAALDDADVHAMRLERKRDAADEASAADRDDDGVHVGKVVEDLEADRALPGEDERVRVRVDESLARLALDLMREREGVVVDAAAEQHLRAVRAADADDRF